MEQNIITLNNIVKNFRIVKHRDGLKGSIKNLFKREYIDITAVSDVSLNIKKGEIVGYLGPNGSGKSTTIKMLTGILTPTSGEVLVNGIVPYENRTSNAKNIGVVFGQRSQLWWALPLIESFKILKELYQIDNKTFEENLNFFKSVLEIDSLLYKPVRQMSLGQRTLCDILAAFLHNPSIVFLDEPTIGLDISMKSKVYEIIKKLNKRYNTTVMITTHDMNDVAALCERVVVISEGQIIYDDITENLKKYFGSVRNLYITFNSLFYEKFSNKKSIIEALKGYCPTLEINENSIEIDDKKIGLLIDEEIVSIADVIQIINAREKIIDISIEDVKIETVIKKLFEGRKDGRKI